MRHWVQRVWHCLAWGEMDMGHVESRFPAQAEICLKEEWRFYSSDLSESERRINEALIDIDIVPLPLHLVAVNDPDWDEFRGMTENFWSGD